MDEGTRRTRHSDSMRQALLSALISTLALFILAPTVGDALDVTTNITQTQGTGDLGTHVAPPNNHVYDITGGTRPGPGDGGPILFHSFGDFTVGAGDTANFLNTTPTITTTNILGRVTGGNPSSLFGTIDTLSYPGANLFLVNPAGIVFGPTASLNVGGSVSFTTAQYIRLFDGLSSANFYANSAFDGQPNSVLTVASVGEFGFLPAAYGFLDSNPAAISVQGSTLTVQPFQSISLVGGNQGFNYTDSDTGVSTSVPGGVTVTGGGLSAPSGRIHLASTASPGEFAAVPGESLANATMLQAVPNNPVDPASAVSFTSFGSVSLAPGSSINVSGANTMWIKGGQLVLSVNDATLSTFDVSPTPPDTDTISLSRGSSIVTSNAGADTGAEVQLIASNVQLEGASILSTTTGSERGGDISITDAHTVNLFNGAQIVSSTTGAGNGGNITISTTDTPISSVTASGVDSDGTLSGVVNPFVGIVTSGVFSTASAGGNGGQISITAPTVTLDNFGTFATINSGDGIGGNITANVGTLSLNGASINSNNSSFVIGEDGNFIIGIGQGGKLTIQGRTGADSAADSVMLNNGSLISTQTFSSKPGGDVAIAAEDVHLDASAISTTTFGPGSGGEVHITAGSLTLENTSTMTTETSFLGGVGGELLLNVGTLHLMGGAFGGSLIQSLNGPGADLDGNGVIDVNGKGQGGDITIQGMGMTQGVNNPAVSVVLSGGSAITTGALTGSGGGGQISIRATFLDLKEASVIASSTSALGADLDSNGELDDVTAGAGGAILVSVQNLSVVDGATISSSTALAETLAVAGGPVTVEGLKGPGSLADSVLLSGQNTSISSNSRFGVPGDLTVNAETLTITNGAVINTGSALSGPAGNVELTANSVVISAGGQIFSRSATRTAGEVTITADELTLANGSIVTRTFSELGGRGGNVVLNGGTVSLTNGASINSQSETFSTGQAGNITMNNLESLMLSNHAEITSSSKGIVANAGDAGTITTTGNTVNLASGSSITSSTIGAGNAGQVVITTPTLNVDDASITTSTSGSGNAGTITANVGALTLTNAAEISSSSTGKTANAGAAGSITIQGVGGTATEANSLLVSGKNSLISTTTAGPGQGGNIQIAANQMRVEQLGKITAETLGKGNAGSVTLTGDSLTVASGGRIEASTSSEGAGGSIVVTTTGDVTVSGVSSDGQTRSGIFAKTQPPSVAGGGAAKPGKAGNITIIHAKNFLLNDGAQIDSSTTSGGAGGSVAITTTQNITIDGSSTRLTSNATRGDGTGGSIILVAKNITVRDSGSVTAATGGKGDAGSITLTALDQLLLQSAGTITTSTSGSGKGGTITIQAGQVLLDGPGTSITADTLRPFADLTISITILHPNDGDLVVQIDSPTGTRVALLSRVGGSGDNFENTSFNDQAATAISGTAPFTGTFKPREPLGQIVNELTSGDWTLNVRDQAANGTGGTLQNWTLQIGQQTFQSTDGSLLIPDGGNVQSTITVANPAAPTVPGLGEASGSGGSVTINAGTVMVQNGATMSATTSGTGDAGQVFITTPDLSLNHGTITTSTSSSGNAGSITAKVGTLTLTNGAEMSSSSTGDATGAAGSVTIQGLASPANSVTITDSLLLTSAANTGQGGNIMVDATTLTLNNAKISASVKNFDNSPDSPDSATVGLGNIDLTASTMTMNGSTVTTESSGSRNAGDIRINPHVAGDSFEMQNSTINTSGELSDGGNIEINVNNMFRMTNSVVTSSVGNPEKTDTTGGNITIDPQFVILQNSQILAQAFAGTGGNINITSNVFLADPNSLVDASSKLGISGTVDIHAPVQNVSGELVVLSQDFASAAALLAQQCAARVADGKFSTFVVAAREGLPVEPGGFLSSPSFLTELGVSALSGQPPQTTRSAAERSFPEHDARPLQLAKLGSACHR